jgi:hypothetical protein
LFRRHGLADLEEVAEHHSLTLGAQTCRFGQGGIDYRSRIGRIREEVLQLQVLRVDLPAPLLAVRKLGCME